MLHRSREEILESSPGSEEPTATDDQPRQQIPPAAPRSGLPRHPVGTLVIVLIYGILFGIGWLLVYFLLFLPRGRVGG